VRDEYSAVVKKHLDDPGRVREQLRVMTTVAPHILAEQPFWGAIIARRNSARVDVAMRGWMDQVLRYSRRDQLSLNYALDQAALDVFVFNADNRESDIHRWITTSVLPKDKGSRYARGSSYTLRDHFVDFLISNRFSRRLRWILWGD
jgi:hypothetical protein